MTRPLLRSITPLKLVAGDIAFIAGWTLLFIIMRLYNISHLDPKTRRKLIDLLGTFKHTKIIATHEHIIAYSLVFEKP